MKIVITGSDGFIGTHLSRDLPATHEIIALDIRHGVDVCNWDHIKDIKGADVVVHLANKSFVPESYEKPLDFYSTNFNSTLNMLEFCKNNDAKLIYFSSYVYGRPAYLPIDEKHPLQPFNPYAHSKIICEELCRGYNMNFKVPVIIFRPFNIYGPGQNEDFLIPKMIRQAGQGMIEIRDERPKRDYIHVNDIIAAIKSAIEYHPAESLEIFNLGNGSSYSVKEIADLIIRFSPHEVHFSSLKEERPNEVMDTVADIEKAKKLLNWAPVITIENGIRSLLNL